MTRVIFVLILYAVHHSTCWASLYPGSIAIITSSKSWVRRSDQTWRDWNTRLGLGQINFPTNLEAPLAFPITSGGVGCEIVIPMDDVANDEELIQSPAEKTCPKQAHTQPEDKVLWINPDNWSPTMALSVNLAVPHIERIPCSYDFIRFSGLLADFIVILPNKNISIQRMSYEGAIISNYNFKTMLKKENFVKHFVVHGAQDVTELLTFTGKDCPDVTGCLCGTMKFYQEVCAIVRPKCNLTLPCPRPIQPVGHCCPMCGVSVQMTYDPQRFVMKKLYTVIFKKLIDDTNDIDWHVSKISEGILQLIFTSEHEYDSRDIYVLTEDLIRSVLQVEHLGIITYTVTSSGSARDPKIWYEAIRITLYIIGSAVAFISGYFLCTTKNLETLHTWLRKKTTKFEKLDSTVDDNDESDEQAEEVEGKRDDDEDGNLVETAENEAESESEDVFVELQATSEGEDSPSSSKEFEAIEILLDIPESKS